MLRAGNSWYVIRGFHRRAEVQHHVLRDDDLSRDIARSDHQRIERAWTTRRRHHDSLKRHQNVANVDGVSADVNYPRQRKIRLCEHDPHFSDIEIVHPQIVWAALRIRHRFGWTNHLIKITRRNSFFRALAEVYVLGFGAEHAVAGIELRNDLQFFRERSSSNRARAIEILKFDLRHRLLRLNDDSLGNRRRLRWRWGRLLNRPLRGRYLRDRFTVFGLGLRLRFRFGRPSLCDWDYRFDEDLILRINPVRIDDMFVLLPQLWPQS